MQISILTQHNLEKSQTLVKEKGDNFAVAATNSRQGPILYQIYMEGILDENNQNNNKVLPQERGRIVAYCWDRYRGRKKSLTLRSQVNVGES